MAETWFDRLDAAVKQDGRSLRALSIAAGCGPNFLQQMLRDRKEPGVDRFLSILNQLGTGATLYVLTGQEFGKDDEDALKLFLDLDADLRQRAAAILDALKAREATS